VVITLWRKPVTITAAPGEQFTVLLPDGSRVELNSGSRLAYRRRFESWPGIPMPKRRINLEGEAYFDVVPGKRPFVVESFNAQVRVMGTSFNVRARFDDLRRETRVTLSSGHVQVVPLAQPDRAVVLDAAGEMTRIQDAGTAQDSAALAPRVVDLDRMLAWRTRGFSAVDMPLGAVLADIERRFALRIRLDAAIDASHSVNVFIHQNPEAPEVIQDICLSVGCQFRPTNQGFDIFLPDTLP
jgi:ferric-dicitrate binding protein FerR (iron transport regulator)